MLEAIEAFGPAAYLRTSFWLYPLLNAAHILSIGILVTSALLMDLRVLGLGRDLPAVGVISYLRRVAILALLAAALAGGLLFSVQPVEYFGNPAFRIKMILLACALLNALAFTSFRLDPGRRPAARVMALISIVLWLGVLVSGRFIGFLE